MPHWISPNFRDDQFPQGLTLDDKICVFADRVLGWQLDIADKIQLEIPHSGFAVLSIVLSYFEMMAEYRDGYVGTGRSEQYFREGVRAVFPDLPQDQEEAVETLVYKLYKDVRCGMYHNGLTGPDVELTGEIRHPIEFLVEPRVLRVNPHLLVPAIRNHFHAYLGSLRTFRDAEKRHNFQKRFDGKRERLPSS